MLLILEIILTVAAWRRGWKGWALVPLGVAVLLGMVIGGAIGADGGDISEAAGALLFLDIVCCLIPLIVMVARPRKVSQGVEEVEEASDESPQYGPTTTTQTAHPLSASSDAVSSSMSRIDK